MQAARQFWKLLMPDAFSLSQLAPSSKDLFGTVVVAGINPKTVTVMVDSQWYHEKYKINLRKRSKIRVHDEENFCIVGDKVIIRHCRPMSKQKKFYVRKIVYAFPRNYEIQQRMKDQTELPKDFLLDQEFDFYKGEVKEEKSQDKQEEEAVKEEVEMGSIEEEEVKESKK